MYLMMTIIMWEMNYCFFAHNYYSIQSLNEFHSLQRRGRATNSAMQWGPGQKILKGAPMLKLFIIKIWMEWIVVFYLICKKLKLKF